jgi:hypothetical protein
VRILLSFILVLILSASLSAQSLQRIEADFTLKESDRVGNKKLSVGKVFFDKNIRVIVFKITFPYEEVLCVHERGVTRFKADTVFQEVWMEGLVDVNIFNLFLNGNLEYYGLKQSQFELKDIEQDNQKIISTWVHPRGKKLGIGKMLLATEDKKISGLITFNADDVLASKQLFEEYIETNGYFFPSQVIQYQYVNNEKEIRISNYREIKLNAYENDDWYRYYARHKRK